MLRMRQFTTKLLDDDLNLCTGHRAGLHQCQPRIYHLIKIGINEGAVAVLPRTILQWQSNQVPKPPCRHMILIRK
ncbi:hypothetical protein D3C72_545050 [compost metagenome]